MDNYNFFLTNQEGINRASTRAQILGGVVVVSVSFITSMVSGPNDSFDHCDTWEPQGEIRVADGYGCYETEPCSVSLIETAFSHTLVLKPYYPNGIVRWLVYAPQPFNSERELLEYVADALRRENHYAQVALNDSSGG